MLTNLLEMRFCWGQERGYFLFWFCSQMMTLQRWHNENEKSTKTTDTWWDATKNDKRPPPRGGMPRWWDTIKMAAWPLKWGWQDTRHKTQDTKHNEMHQGKNQGYEDEEMLSRQLEMIKIRTQLWRGWWGGCIKMRTTETETRDQGTSRWRMWRCSLVHMETQWDVWKVERPPRPQWNDEGLIVLMIIGRDSGFVWIRGRGVPCGSWQKNVVVLCFGVSFTGPCPIDQKRFHKKNAHET